MDKITLENNEQVHIFFLIIDVMYSQTSYFYFSQKIWNSKHVPWPPVNETEFWPHGVVITIQVNILSYKRLTSDLPLK